MCQTQHLTQKNAFYWETTDGRALEPALLKLVRRLQIRSPPGRGAGERQRLCLPRSGQGQDILPVSRSAFLRFWKLLP